MPKRRETIAKTEEKLITKTSIIKERGWSAKMIAHYLGPPDSTKSNPHYQCAPPMHLYLLRRIERVEASEEFREEQRSRQKRRDAAAKGVATKQEKIETYLENLQFEIPQLEKGDLVRQACERYNSGPMERNAELASPSSDEKFLARICVNYLRHHIMSGYEIALENTAGRPGAKEAYIEIKSAVLSEIAFEYPWLDAECKRQREFLSLRLLYMP